MTKLLHSEKNITRAEKSKAFGKDRLLVEMVNIARSQGGQGILENSREFTGLCNMRLAKKGIYENLLEFTRKNETGGIGKAEAFSNLATSIASDMFDSEHIFMEAVEVAKQIDDPKTKAEIAFKIIDDLLIASLEFKRNIGAFMEKELNACRGGHMTPGLAKILEGITAPK